ncbi:MAG: acyl-ACP--UDP-N-acetylglucosamine O-acyltransferase [Campylobacteraceae bacterium]|jgi:UDP-N-acetylglucosamine acyltransferase|nr:acyl-ACP--UDP-N-acetylglucosamine O-acyltransferase [Campylobacteraceae bacterium]
MKNIHPTAIIEEGAIIEDGVTIEAYAFVSSKSRVGAYSEIKQGARILGGTTIGERVRIYSYAIIGGDPQDISFQVGETSRVIIGDDTTVREFVTINGGSQKGDFTTRIGKNCFIMNFCHIAHDCTISDNVILANSATLAGHVEIGKDTVIGGLTPVHQFVKIGEGCMIGGASALSQDVPPFCLAEGNRAYLRGLNLIGLRRRESKEDIDALSIAYKALFRSGKPLRQSAEEILNTTASDKVRLLCEFVLNTKRGINYERANSEKV